MTEVLHVAAFTEDPAGGNPAGVVLDAAGMGAEAMQALAARLGYSESAFVVRRDDEPGHYDVRYFSPQDEVPFCGHATVAAGAALARRDGPGDYVFHVLSGEVGVRTAVDQVGGREGSGHSDRGEIATATLTSVVPSVRDVSEADVDRALELLRWSRDDLDPTLPPRIAYAGAHHLVLACATRERLADLDYDFEGLRAFMLERDLITLDLVWRDAPLLFWARNPFPVGGVVEDPATGAAALAFGAYLRELGAVDVPARIEIRQGNDLGRPSRLLVELAAGRPEVQVTGSAVAIPV